MTQVVMNKQKTIALIAHDHQKEDLVEWCVRNQEELKKHFLCGTGTTSKMIAEATGLPVKPYKSGPLGGDQQIGARIAEGEIDMMIFFWDPLEAQPHDPCTAANRSCLRYSGSDQPGNSRFYDLVLLYGSGIQSRTSGLPDNFGRRNRENFKIRTVKHLQIYRFDFDHPAEPDRVFFYAELLQKVLP